MNYADLTAANFEMVRANQIQLVGARLINTNLQEAKLYEANLADAVMEGARLRFTIFQGAFMEGCQGCPHDW